jgi:hypothetical protein
MEKYKGRTKDYCEWDPIRNREAESVYWVGYDLVIPGCQNKATVIVGARPNWMLCEACSKLPRFQKLRKRVPITRKCSECGGDVYPGTYLDTKTGEEKTHWSDTCTQCTLYVDEFELIKDAQPAACSGQAAETAR